LFRIAHANHTALPADQWLQPNLNRLKWGIVDEVEKLGFVPEVFTNPKGKPGLASAKSGIRATRMKLRDAALVRPYWNSALEISGRRWTTCSEASADALPESQT
jgi:hypothetical protein